jgi:hypothetical protein
MRAGQTLSMMIIALNRRYESLLQEHGLLVYPTPSWEVIEFSPNPDEKECAKHLAKQGVSIAEAGDSQQYAHHGCLMPRRRTRMCNIASRSTAY